MNTRDEQLSEEMLKYVERLAAAAFTEKEMAIALEIKNDKLKMLLQDEENPFFKAVMKGKLERQLVLRERIFQDATNGSSPAQALAMRIIDESNIKSKMRN